MYATGPEFQHDDPPATQAAQLRPRPQRPERLIAVLVGVVAALAVTVIAFFLMNRNTAPTLTRADYEEAVARWDEHGPKNYDLDIELGGNRPGKVHVEVRDGEVTHMIRDGVEPKQRHTWYYWSVPGMFDTIDREFEMAQDPAAAFNVPVGTQVVLWARFDPKLGYPLEFHRVVLGTANEVHWTVTRFQSVEPPA